MVQEILCTRNKMYMKYYDTWNDIRVGFSSGLHSVYLALILSLQIFSTPSSIFVVFLKNSISCYVLC